jgi:hypothetical protein
MSFGVNPNVVPMMRPIGAPAGGNLGEQRQAALQSAPTLEAMNKIAQREKAARQAAQHFNAGSKRSALPPPKVQKKNKA